ncbi:hypothetical protein [Actinomadura sp. 21ATH]|uniref:hypothetical protein n=1 Tax=Actinomadura sp. 21ATH TaxID=1735444 RepID=UPI0035BFF904
MNVRLVAGAAILALVFGGTFVAAGLDMGWLAATVTVVVATVVLGLTAVAVALIHEGMDRR